MKLLSGSVQGMSAFALFYQVISYLLITNWLLLACSPNKLGNFIEEIRRLKFELNTRCGQKVLGPIFFGEIH